MKKFTNRNEDIELKLRWKYAFSFLAFAFILTYWGISSAHIGSALIGAGIWGFVEMLIDREVYGK